ncbi:MAG: hypothetical protein L3J43_10105 [Sulfurovum sp.]|nr:hypothetical protein [Sulfurovum sp.]
MNLENIKQMYPKVFKTLPEDLDELRYLMVIDENYMDEDSDEFDGMDPEDFNYLLYITDTLQEAVGEEVIVALVKKLKVHKEIQEFYLSEIDLYGLQTGLDKEGIGHMVLSTLEEVMA